tara:strand:- start:1924 stop:2085 length:162 start_codon:yes stop_codon:yes gene_type:complete
MFKAKVRITPNEIKKVIEDSVRQMRLDIRRNQNEIRSLRTQVFSLKAQLEKEK